MSLRILISGGGTGGHLFPALAVAQEFKERVADCEILFVGAGRRMDTQALAGCGIAHVTIPCGALKGGNWRRRIKTMATMPLSLWRALAIIREFDPHLVFGVGGYVTGPVLAAARLLRRPVCIHEQNSVPGMANRQVGRFAQRIFISIPGSEAYFPKGRVVLSGNPVRRDFLRCRETQNRRPGGNSGGVFTLMVVGGSLGAHALNTLVPRAVELLQGRGLNDVRVIHQTGPEDEDMVTQAYERLGVMAEVKGFFSDMASRLVRADLLICRAGATTLAELTVLGKAAILIPYPYAADDHQAKNGEYLVSGGGARMFSQDGLNAERLAAEIASLMADPAELKAMGEAALKLARPQAAANIVTDCLTIIGKK